MSLQIWLPLIKDYKNYGLSDLQFAPVSTNTVMVSGGKVGASCYYNNSHQAGGFVSNKTIALGNNITMSCWFKFTSLTPDSALGGSMGGQHRYQTNSGMGLTIKYISSTTGYLSCNTGNGSSRTYNTYCGNTLLTANTWYHAALTYDGATIKLYLNGKLDGAHSYSGQYSPADYIHVFGWAFGDVTIAPNIYGGYKLYGYLNDFRIYNHTCTAKEISEIAKGLSLHYKLDGESPNLAMNAGYDKTGSGYLIASYNFDRAGFGRYLKAGEKHTVTVCFTPHANFSYFNPHLNSGAWGGWLPAMYSDGTTARQIVSATSMDGWVYSNGSNHNVNPDSDPSRTVMHFYGRNKDGSANNANVTIHWVMVQYGNQPKALYWAPSASEDFNRYNKEPDCSGFCHDGTRNKALYGVDGAPRYSQAALFESNASVEGYLDTNGWLDSTVTAWIRPKDYSAGSDDRSCIMIGGMYVTLCTNGKLAVYCYGKTNSGYHESNATIPTAKWTHVAAVWDNAAAQCRIYINGQLDKTITGCSGAMSSPWHQRKHIGRELWWAENHDNQWHRPFSGQISDVRIYATPLSTADIAEMYNTPVSLTKDGTLMAYEFSENTSTERQIKKTGTVTANNFTTKYAPLSNMKVKGLGDGSMWGRIHHLNLRSSKALFANDSEVANCDLPNRYSQLGMVDKFKNSNGTYEFMLTYPGLVKYCPSGYTRLESIETTGSQMIRTGVYPYSSEGYVRGHRWELDIEFKANGVRQLMGYGPFGGEYWGVNSNLYEGLSTPCGKRNAIVHDYSNGTAGGNTLWVDHDQRGVGANLETSYEYVLFALNWNGGPGYFCYSKLYGCKCYQGTTLIRDFIPVRRNVDGAIGLFDLVGNRFYSEANGRPLIPHEENTYTPIEYIESNGTQYIDTGYSAPEGFTFDLAFSYNAVEGSYIVGSHNPAAPYGRNGVGSIVAGSWELGTGDSCPQAGAITVGQKYRLQGSTVKGNSYLDVNGVRTITTADGTSRSSYNLYVFWEQYGQINGGSPIKGKLYYLKIYAPNGTLVRDFIPAVSSMNGATGLYDLVNNKFYASETRDPFNAGGAPKDETCPYEFLEYIASSTGSGQYINTGIYPTNNTSIHMKAMPIDATSMFGAIGAGGDFNMTSGGAGNYFYWGNQGNKNAIVNYYYQIHYWSLSNTGSRVDNKPLASYSDYAWSSSVPMYLFARNNAGSLNDYGACRIYECDVYENGVLIMSLHPARRKSDGAIGMFNSVAGNFFTNAHTGSGFIAGPPKYGTYSKAIPCYYRWLQTNSPNVGYDSASGYKPISLGPVGGDGGGLAFGRPLTYSKAPSGSTYSANTRGDWWTPIGQKTNYSNMIPAASFGTELETELWVRFDKLGDVNSLSVQKYNTIASKDFMEV